jgi:hypothetical protein
MVRRSTNTFAIKVREHPHRVDILETVARQHAEAIADAARRLSDDAWFRWSPTRIWPPVLTYGFKTQEAADAFRAWAAEHLGQR